MHYIDLIVGALIGLLLFFSSIYAYSIGVKHGKQLSSGIVPKVEINPIKAVIEAKEEAKAKEEIKKLDDELKDILNTTKESMLESITKGAK